MTEKQELKKLYLKELKRRFSNVFGKKHRQYFEEREASLGDFLHIVYHNEFETIHLHIYHTLQVNITITDLPVADYMLNELLTITRDIENYIYHYLFSNKLYEITGSRD